MSTLSGHRLLTLWRPAARSRVTELYPSPWRASFHELLTSVKKDLLIAAPYIKASEAKWICSVLTMPGMPPELRLQVLTDVRSESVLGGSLDIEALHVFTQVIPNAQVVNLPRLHAKVYIVDADMAVVTSANLTPSGLDSNYEYGVGIREPSAVSRIRRDLEAYAHIGNVLAPEVLMDLALVGRELSTEYQELQRSTRAGLRRRFNQKLRAANFEFLRAQVGSRSANSLFSEAITYILAKEPLATRDLHPKVQRLLPDLCDDSVELVINGEHFGKRWKHAVRNAQQSLKRYGVIRFDGRRWSLTSGRAYEKDDESA